MAGQSPTRQGRFCQSATGDSPKGRAALLLSWHAGFARAHSGPTPFCSRGACGARSSANRLGRATAEDREVVDSPAAELLRRLGVSNARDLSEAHPSIAPGRILRCANPLGLSSEEARLLLQGFSLKHLVDLRSEDERADDEGAPLLEGVRQLQYRRSGGMLQVFPPTALARGNVFGAEPHCHHLPLINKSRYFGALLGRVPLSTWGSALAWGFVDRGRSRSVVMRHINDGGLEELYEIILDTAKLELCAALRVVTKGLEHGDNVLFFCKVGKDRTGLLAALLLLCTGASWDEVVADYHRSDECHAVALGGLEAEGRLAGLDWHTFSRAPPSAMRRTLKWLAATYGSPFLYLDSIGFDARWRRRLAAALRGENVAVKHPPRDGVHTATPPTPSTPPGSNHDAAPLARHAAAGAEAGAEGD